jgi:glycogen operon protein
MYSPDRAFVPAITSEPAYQPGSPFPQGATWNGKGVNFAVFAEHAEEMHLCLFDSAEQAVETRRIRVRERTNGIWHIFVPGIEPGQHYGYRVHGPYDPSRGLRFNANKLLLDPYAKAIGRALIWDDSVFGYTVGHPDADLSFDERDSAHTAPLGVVIDNRFDWSDEDRPSVPWHDTVIYEAHVRGLTMNHPDVPEELRGTYSGISSAPIISHLHALGITAIELMPVHHFLNDRHLLEKGLSNYWGYNTLGYFAPEPAYASRKRRPADVVREFKQMVKDLHNAGIEVILDVVYNHTAEGNQLGPTVSFRGIDNLAHYRTVEGDPRFYMDYTGCGNTLNMLHPHSLQLLMDSLRYWVTEMHIDGFRFDLASALARELKDVNQLGPFFDTIYQDPTLATIKLIAEPWDLGEGGYQVGNFPVGWTEWNGKYRDTVRRFWKGEAGVLGELATRLSGSPDLYEQSRRLPTAGINFVTAHDGFTLHDLVSFDNKHNEANLEDNRDGSDDNHSWNCGVEGPTDDEAVLALRERQKRNLWCTLLLSQGVPMISGGDEIGRTQQGNNNGYCQNNDLSWHQWDLDSRRSEFFDFARKVVHLRRVHPNFRRRSFSEPGHEQWARTQEAVKWFRSDGAELTQEDWESGWMRALGMYLNGDSPSIRGKDGEYTRDDAFLLLFNSHHEDLDFRLAFPPEVRWKVVLDTARPDLPQDAETIAAGDIYALRAGSMAVLSHE